MHKQINGFKMAYSDEGDGHPMLFIHGYPLNRKMWEPQINNLPDFVRLIAPDLRGHGESESIPGPYSMDLLADDLAALLDDLEIRSQVVICGLSMGGYVALAFQRKYADRIAAMVLTATRAAPDSAEGKLARDKSAETARKNGVEAIIAGMLPKLLASENYENEPALVERLGEIMRLTSLEGVLGALEGMKERPDSRPDLERFAFPTLILHGQEDQIIPIQEAKEMQASLPDGRLQLIPRAGHLLNMEQPALFNAAIRSFLSSVFFRSD
jgi:pimeloyl-ACP methyl ester carboxylesterase